MADARVVLLGRDVGQESQLHFSEISLCVTGVAAPLAVWSRWWAENAFAELLEVFERTRGIEQGADFGWRKDAASGSEIVGFRGDVAALASGCAVLSSIIVLTRTLRHLPEEAYSALV